MPSKTETNLRGASSILSDLKQLWMIPFVSKIQQNAKVPVFLLCNLLALEGGAYYISYFNNVYHINTYFLQHIKSSSITHHPVISHPKTCFQKGFQPRDLPTPSRKLPEIRPVNLDLSTKMDALENASPASHMASFRISM